jgi:hypothetical protein
MLRATIGNDLLLGFLLAFALLQKRLWLGHFGWKQDCVSYMKMTGQMGKGDTKDGRV